MKTRPARNKNIITRSKRKLLLRIGIVFLLFFTSSIFIGIYSFYKYINQSFASALSTSEYSVIDDNIPTISYIVVQDLSVSPPIVSKIEYIVLDKISKKEISYSIDLSNNYEIPGRYGQENFSKMFALGGLNTSNPLDSGIAAINRALFKLFGFKVDKYVLIDELHSESFDNLWDEGNFIHLLRSGVLDRNTRTDLNIKELYDLSGFINSLPKDRKIKENAPKCFCSTNDLDAIIRESTYDSVVAQEKNNISVLNGTNYEGLASFGARVVRNIGGRVIAVDNSEKFYDSSYIIADNTDSATVKFLSDVFKIKNIISKSESYSFMENVIDRSDVVLIFGFDTSGDLY